jgi:hypothetical protein
MAAPAGEDGPMAEVSETLPEKGQKNPDRNGE